MTWIYSRLFTTCIRLYGTEELVVCNGCVTAHGFTVDLLAYGKDSKHSQEHQPSGCYPCSVLSFRKF